MVKTGFTLGYFLFLNNRVQSPGIHQGYHTYPKYSDRQALASSVDPDQMAQNEVSDQHLHALTKQVSDNILTM